MMLRSLHVCLAADFVLKAQRPNVGNTAACMSKANRLARYETDDAIGNSIR